jgi:hypothetical protein
VPEPDFLHSKLQALVKLAIPLFFPPSYKTILFLNKLIVQGSKINISRILI